MTFGCWKSWIHNCMHNLHWTFASEIWFQKLHLGGSSKLRDKNHNKLEPFKFSHNTQSWQNFCQYWHQRLYYVKRKKIITSFCGHFMYIETLIKVVKWSMKSPYSIQCFVPDTPSFCGHIWSHVDLRSETFDIWWPFESPILPFTPLLYPSVLKL